MKMGFLRRGRSNSRRGAVAVEFALVAPILLLILGGAFDAARFVWYQTDLLQALRAGVQYAVGDSANLTQISNVVRASTRLSQSNSFTHPTPDCGCVPMTDATNLPATWSACASTPCTSQRKYMRLTASFAYTPLVGRMVGLLPGTASYTTYLRLQ
jgi:Flp pilus assembly protein TadG